MTIIVMIMKIITIITIWRLDPGSEDGGKKQTDRQTDRQTNAHVGSREKKIVPTFPRALNETMSPARARDRVNDRLLI